MEQIAIIGKYNTEDGVADGQAVKTQILVREIERAFGKDAVLRINTFNWKKNPAALFAKSLKAVRKCGNVIFMTDEGGIKVFPWLLNAGNFLGKCKLHYVVVGGWLVNFLGRNRFISANLKRFDGIYVETRAMKSGLEKLGFSNVYRMPNCKDLQLLSEDELVCGHEVPYKLCTFSRVMEEKGIADAVNAVKAVNAHFGKTVYTLDIFGQVDPRQTEWFEKLCASFPAEIRYCGIIPYDRSVETVKNYFALLFPTKFYTEGIPGTIIDAYAAGVPVISSEWENYADIVTPGMTGFTYPFLKQECMKDILITLAEKPELAAAMKKQCLTKAREYLPENTLDVLFQAIS